MPKRVGRNMIRNVCTRKNENQNYAHFLSKYRLTINQACMQYTVGIKLYPLTIICKYKLVFWI